MPFAGLVEGTDGNFYGTTDVGGANVRSGIGSTGGGTVFKITPSGTLTTLYSFCSQSGCTDGQRPEAPLCLGTDGNLYGTTAYGGAFGSGTVFQVTPGGALTTLHSFSGTDGDIPEGALFQATNGMFYGTTSGGSAPANRGTVFSLSMGLGQGSVRS